MNEENNKDIEVIKASIEEIKKKIGGLGRSVANFDITITDTLAIRISTKEGFMVEYPMLTVAGTASVNRTWYFLASWLSEWTDEARHAVEGFLGFVLYPTSMALSFDEQYINEIKEATIAAIKRNNERMMQDASERAEADADSDEEPE